MFRLNSLPKHCFVRLRFDLFILSGPDGLIRSDGRYGEDTWNLDMGGTRLIGTTFSNFRNDPYAQKQSWPDDYPPQFGIRPDWYSKILGNDIWEENLSLGYYNGREGDSGERPLKYDRYAAYPVDLIIPHESDRLELCFNARFQEAFGEISAMNLSKDEAWALDHVRVDIFDRPLDLTAEQMEQCWKGLLGSNGLKAAAARQIFIAAGKKGLDFLVKKKRNGPAELSKNDRFPGFRIWRIEQLMKESKTH